MEPSTSILESPKPAPKPPSRLKSWMRELGAAGPLAVVMIVLPVLGGLALLGFLSRLGPWLRSHESPLVVAGATGMVALLAGFSLVPTYMLEIIAGWSFGPVFGVVVAVGGITLAALIGYALSHRIVGATVMHSIHHHPRFEVVRDAMLGSGQLKAGTIVALLRLAPIVPFGATNLLMASAGCRPVPFAVGTALGIFPRTAAIVFMAAEMRQLSFTQNKGLLVASAVATVVVIAIISLIAKRALAHVTRDGRAA